MILYIHICYTYYVYIYIHMQPIFNDFCNFFYIIFIILTDDDDDDDEPERIVLRWDGAHTTIYSTTAKCLMQDITP